MEHVVEDWVDDASSTCSRGRVVWGQGRAPRGELARSGRQGDSTAEGSGLVIMERNVADKAADVEARWEEQRQTMASSSHGPPTLRTRRCRSGLRTVTLYTRIKVSEHHVSSLLLGSLGDLWRRS